MAEKENSQNKKIDFPREMGRVDNPDTNHNQIIDGAGENRSDEFRLLSDNALTGIAILQDGSVKYANQSMADILGFSVEEIRGWNADKFDTVIHPDDVPRADEQTRRGQTDEDNAIAQRSHRIITKAGQVKWIDRYSRKIPFRGRQADFITIIDISKQKEVEEALRTSESRYRELFSGVMEGIGIVDENEIVRFCNPAFAEIFDEDSVDSMTGKNLFDYIPDDQKDYLTSLTAERRRNVSARYEMKIKTAKNNIRIIMVTASPRFGKDGKYIGAFGTVVDLTERRKAEESLKAAHKELEKQYRERTRELEEANLRKKAMFDLYTIFELSRNFNAMLDYRSLLDSFVLAALGRVGSSGAVLYLPQELGSEEFKLARAEGKISFPDRNVSIYQTEPCCQYIASMNRPVLISEIIDKFESSAMLELLENFPSGLIVPLVFQTKLRGILILSSKESRLPFHDNDIEFLSILASQTAVSIENSRLYESEKEALNRLQSAQKLLVQSERSAALGDLSAKIAHEINNPLGIIKNYLSLTTRNIAEQDKALNYTRIIKKEIDRIALIVKQLLDFHRPIAINFTKIDLVSVIGEILSLLDRQLTNAGIVVTVKKTDNFPEIIAWSDGLKQVFINLMVNAMDAMDGKGEVSINLEKTEQTIICTLEDTGPGIASEHVSHIFEPYYTTKLASGGSGLGLSICYSIIKNHNGSIKYSNTNRGGCFRIELPIEHEEA
jgi:PAS domain S-box-containing protein